MKVVAFLQNMWFKDPARMERQLATTFKGDREKFIRTWLFWSCLTGKRLRQAFGEELCDEIVWEEASPKMGGHSSSAFPADPIHIGGVIRRHNPDVVMAFGKIAVSGVVSLVQNLGALEPGWTLIAGPHPAARGNEVLGQLATMANQLRSMTAVMPV
jgi:hypothetical protein